jgi:hypothetical protein
MLEPQLHPTIVAIFEPVSCQQRPESTEWPLEDFGCGPRKGRWSGGRRFSRRRMGSVTTPMLKKTASSKFTTPNRYSGRFTTFNCPSFQCNKPRVAVVEAEETWTLGHSCDHCGRSTPPKFLLLSVADTLRQTSGAASEGHFAWFGSSFNLVPVTARKGPPSAPSLARRSLTCRRRNRCFGGSTESASWHAGSPQKEGGYTALATGQPHTSLLDCTPPSFAGRSNFSPLRNLDRKGVEERKILHRKYPCIGNRVEVWRYRRGRK